MSNSDWGIKSAVKQGALVVGLGKAAVPVADQLRAALGHRACKGDGWEESKVNHLVVVVECLPTSGEACEAATKFMRQVRASDGYGVYSDIIKRQVAILALGKMGKTSGAAKLEETLLKRGGCKRLVPKVGRADLPPSSDVGALPWTREVCEALSVTMNPELQPQASATVVPAEVVPMVPAVVPSTVPATVSISAPTDHRAMPASDRQQLFARTSVTNGHVRLQLFPVARGLVAPEAAATLTALEAATAALPEGAFTQHEVRIGGLRAVHKQRFSKALVFIGLRAPDGRLLEAILRRGVTDSALVVKMADAAALGDVVMVTGMVERSRGRLSLHVRHIQAEETWATLYGPRVMFRDDAATDAVANAPGRVAGGAGLWASCFRERGRLLMLQVMASHAVRLNDYVTKAHDDVSTIGTVTPVAGIKMGQDDRGLLLRSQQAVSLVRDVLADGAIARYIQRWYVLDELAPTMAAAVEGLCTILRRMAAERQGSGAGDEAPAPLRVRVQAFPRSLETPLVTALRESGCVEPDPRATCVCCAAYIFGAIGYGVADGEGAFREAFEGANRSALRGPVHARPSRTVAPQHLAYATASPDGADEPPPVLVSEPVSDTRAATPSAAPTAEPQQQSGGGAVSRAFYKLREVATRMQLCLDVDCAIDCGASPGGWSTCLVQSGCARVIAVDPGLLFLPPEVDASGQVEHMRMKIEEALPILMARGGKEAVTLDMLVCDMNAPPAVVLSIVRTARPLLRAGAPLVLTFKNSFNSKGAWHAALEAGLEELRTFADDVRVVHLLANTAKETTVVATVRAASFGNGMRSLGTALGGGGEGWLCCSSSRK